MTPQKSFLLTSAALPGLISVAQTVIGCGVGLLVADKMRASKRNTTAVAMISVAVASVVPALVGFVTKQVNAPNSGRGMRKRLRSIREDSGMHEAGVF